MYFITGDWRFFWTENIGNFAHLPSAWDSILNTGIGGPATGTLWITSFLNFTAFFSRLGFSWNLIEFLFWFLPAIFLSFFGAQYLFTSIFPSNKKWSLLAGFIYLFNTYYLMIFSGGQMGVCLAYSLAPFVLARFIKNHKKPSVSNEILFALLLALQLLFDPRLVYITLFIIIFYSLFNIRQFIISKKYFITDFAIPFLIALLLHFFWIFPLIITKNSGSLNTYTGGANFFSFAKFENTISLLHPNWPENIFGKVYFMRPEFLLIPILAYSSILFTNNKNIQTKNNALIFALLGLLGSFLSKGTNEPLGQIYLFLYNHVPGFFLFRDPTKWYILIATSYCVLIPFSVKNTYEKLKSLRNIKFFPKTYQNKFLGQAVLNFKTNYKFKILNIQNIFLISVFLYFVFLIYPYFISRNLIRPRAVPSDYVHLKDMLVNDKEFSRTLWIPQWQRFGYYSDNHPAIGRGELLGSLNAEKEITILKKPGINKLLNLFSVKYIIVPYDSEGEIFITDRNYDQKLYNNVIKELNSIFWLKRVDGFEKIAVYKISGSYGHFWTVSGDKILSKNLVYKEINPADYSLNSLNISKGDKLIFSESFNKGWVLEFDGKEILSDKYNGELNSFVFPKNGNYTVSVIYKPQQWVNLGFKISVISLISILSLLMYFKLKKR